MERVIAYVDGFNLYFGLKSAACERYLWLDVHALAREIIKPRTQAILRTNYFTSRVSDPPDKAARQTPYPEALQAHRPNLRIHYGRLSRRPLCVVAQNGKCSSCLTTARRRRCHSH